jgi:hypothetical protein
MHPDHPFKTIGPEFEPQRERSEGDEDEEEEETTETTEDETDEDDTDDDVIINVRSMS